jgi:hypothetical protein
MEKHCERCGKSFVCTGHIDCWCMTTFIAPKVSNYISGLYTDCICKDCIEEIKGIVLSPELQKK